MAKKKSGFGRFVGALAGTPYDRLMKLIEKTVNQSDDGDDLVREITKLQN